MIVLPEDRPQDPRDWSTGLKLAYAMDRVEFLSDRNPAIALRWIAEVDRLQSIVKADNLIIYPTTVIT